jgi:tRNA (guanine37-N1)-methyltransferase
VRIDVVTIFPGYLEPLNLSLVGKARREGLLDVRVHDLRSWATDRHRTVDDTPAGGGPGMVMRPDVWGRALDELLPAGGREPPVLVVPTPSGEPFTQPLAEELAADLGRGARLVIACGRYEGIDARVSAHYAETGAARVRELSIGDYVLAGGEVAALVLVEAVTRLLPGVLGNPDSLAEESHGAGGLLEGPVYTRPAQWRGRRVPDVLLSGDHARVARWRRDEALRRTVARRPDVLARLDVAALDGADRAVLARLGWLATSGGLRRGVVRRANPADAAALAEVAALTFPLACPPGTPAADVASFVAAHLTEGRFAERLAAPDRYAIHVAGEAGGVLAGYTLAVLPRTADDVPGADGAVAAVVRERPVAELSKCYVRAELHGSGLAAALLDAAHDDLAGRTVGGVPIAAVWLGTNRDNRRARRFYARAGYRVVGRRAFLVGERVNDDVVLVRPLGPARAPGPAG